MYTRWAPSRNDDLDHLASPSPFPEASPTQLTPTSNHPTCLLLHHHGCRPAGGHLVPPGHHRPRARLAGGGRLAAAVRAALRACAAPPPRLRGRAHCAGRQGRRGGRRGGGGGGRGGGGRGGAESGRARLAEAVGAADVPRGGGDVQPGDHLHGRRRRLLPLRLADGGRDGAGDRDDWHLGAIGGCGGGDGVLGAVGAPGAVARVPVAHARVAPPAARRAVRAQRRLRHRQRRAGHVPPRLWLLQQRPRPRPLLRRGAGDHAVRDGVYVRARWPRPPALPRRPHRERALLPAGGCCSPDTSHGQVRGRAVWAIPWSQGAGGGGWDGGTRGGNQEED